MKRTLILMLIVMGFSCEEKVSELALEQGFDYYPIHLGNYWVYDVEEVIFQGFTPDSSSYYLQEEITDSLVSNDGTVKYLLRRSKSLDSTNWEVDSVWTIHMVNQSLIVTENNRPFVKLTFPVQEGTIWDGNAYNTLDEALYYYKKPDGNTSALSLEGQELMSVVIADVPANLVSQDEREVTYGRGIGLLVKDYTTLKFCSIDCDQIGAIESGRVLKQNLIKYGRH